MAALEQAGGSLSACLKAVLPMGGQAKLRDAAAVARWPRLMIQPSATSGQTSWSSNVMNSVNWPIVCSNASALMSPF